MNGSLKSLRERFLFVTDTTVGGASINHMTFERVGGGNKNVMVDPIGEGERILILSNSYYPHHAFLLLPLKKVHPEAEILIQSQFQYFVT